MKRPSFIDRLIIIALILCIIPISATHFGAIYLGRENGLLLGFCVGIPCVTFAAWKLYIDGWRDEDEA